MNKKTIKYAVVITSLYVLTYIINSSFGGYWGNPERDKNITITGLSSHVAVLWQPYLGYNSDYNSDFIGLFFHPLIYLDRTFIHKSKSVVDDDFWDWNKNSKESDWHPQFRKLFKKNNY